MTEPTEPQAHSITHKVDDGTGYIREIYTTGVLLTPGELGNDRSFVLACIDGNLVATQAEEPDAVNFGAYIEEIIDYAVGKRPRNRKFNAKIVTYNPETNKFE